MITIFFYISMFAVGIIVYLRMKQEARVEKLLLQERIELEYKLRNNRKYEQLLKQNQIRKVYLNKSKSNKLRVINYRKHIKHGPINQIISARDSVRGSTFYLEEMDKIA
ncbi:MAG TPA: hypothetical protein GXZ43_06870 [Clostridiaceae bacterium]|nr:hypothetical protein [Clostridiaceae bacterium]